MNKKIIIPSVCGALVICSAVMFALLPHKPKHTPNMVQKQPNEFVIDGGPMMPPAHFGPTHAMVPAPMFGPAPDIEKIINFSHEQHEKLKKLDTDFRHDIKSLHDKGGEIRDSYLEKMDAVLTAEQFRTIQKMRIELRKEMKKLQDEHDKILEKHRHDFESILTPEQKQALEHQHKQNMAPHNGPNTCVNKENLRKNVPQMGQPKPNMEHKKHNAGDKKIKQHNKKNHTKNNNKMD